MPAPVGNGAISDSHRYELLVDAVSDYAIYLLDPEGFVTSWNTGAERIKGYSRTEILGQHFSRFFSPEDLRSNLPARILDTARGAGRHEAEGWRVRKDGTRFWANAIVQPVHDTDGQFLGFAKITRDMTDKVKSQNALLEAERRFRILVDGVVDYAIYMLDTSGIITNWNVGAERLKGYTADEIVGQHFSRFYSKDDRSRGLPSRVLAVAAQEGRMEAEGWRIRKDGSRFWASVVVDAVRDDQGELIGFAKVTRDITERRSALEAMRDSERQFRLLVNNVTDYALYMLDPNGIVTSWNAGAQRIKGYDAEEIIGHHFSRFYTERDRAAGAPARALHTASRAGRFEAEDWRVRKDGSLFWANVVIDRVCDEKGELVGFAKITRDITERREAQRALQEAENQRVQAQKMDALGQLTGGVAHDFNNLLTIIVGQVPRLRKAAAGDAKALKGLDAIETAAERGTALTRQLLTFARRQAVSPKVIDPSAQVEATRGMLATVIGGTVKLATSFGPEVWPVEVDTGEFELAVVNVVLNARDAMADGGLITIALENAVLAAQDTAAGVVGDFVAIRVSDTGQGIAPDVLPKVFEPFFTTKGVGKGTGLGLSQVYGFAHQSGGTITIDSELDRGTVVSIFLPRSNGVQHVRTGDKPAPAAVADARVLVVEDNPDVAAVTVSLLQDLGYRAQAVNASEQALEILARESFDLVVSDIVMPGAMDGLKLAHAIREAYPALPVMLVTGYSHKLADGGIDFPVVRKPFQVSELSRHAARLIASARQPADSNVVRLRDVRPPA